MSKIRYAIVGSNGRMGRTLIEAVLAAEDAELVAALDRADSPAIGRDAGELVGVPCGVKVTSDVDAALAQADCLIDFTRPEGTLEHLAVCRKHKVHAVIGTTGFTAEQKLQIEQVSKDIPVVFAPNMAVGVNATMLK